MNATATASVISTPDYAAIKSKQNAAWSSGNYAKIGATLQIVGESLAEAMDLAPDSRVLDVAAGNGNATLAFARRWCNVVSTDYVESLLASGRKRSEAEALDVKFEIADAENLPYSDGDFDAVVSTFGIMFAPDQQQVAGELIRVCRSKGRIGLANWTPDGFIGNLFKTLGSHVAPPAGVLSPALWGKKDWVEETFAEVSSSLDYRIKNFVFRYRSPEHFMDFFRTYYGPVHKAFQALEISQQDALRSDILALVHRFNSATDGSMRVAAEYAEIIIDRN
ncbi:MAG: class I SAM-dependent methyltransferase [Proteobacteria bacterium]|nr:class I SAM-dependent methyltransferase [Pseudomonadota bacterium]